MKPVVDPSQVVIRPVHPESPEARYCLERYYAELNRRFELGFDPASSLPAPPADLLPPNGRFLVCFGGAGAIGSGAVTMIDSDIASIKRMWVDEDARGMGLGRRILRALEKHAADLGAHTVRLETNPALSEAIRLYRSAGYREVEAFNEDPYAGHWFEKRLTPD